MQQTYTNDYLKIRDEYTHARKRMFWCLLAGLGAMIVAAAIKNYLWDHWMMQAMMILVFIPGFIMVFRMLLIEDKLAKLTPKKDYLEFQENEKQYKNLCNLFYILSLISAFTALIVLIISAMHDYGWINFQVENFTLIVLFTGLSALTSLSSFKYVVALRKQYLKIKEKEPR